MPEATTTEMAAAWADRYARRADDIRDLKAAIDRGEIDFRDLEMSDR
jgi:predicted trehalose synthase